MSHTFYESNSITLARFAGGRASGVKQGTRMIQITGENGFVPSKTRQTITCTEAEWHELLAAYEDQA